MTDSLPESSRAVSAATGSAAHLGTPCRDASDDAPRLSTSVDAPFDAAALDDGRLVRLSYQDTCVLVAPHVGGSIAAFYDEKGSGLSATPFHWLRPATRAAIDARDPLGMASFPLMPYCNRIRDGRFRFVGNTVALPNGEGPLRHALHGHAWRRPWTVEAQTGNALTLSFLHEPMPEQEPSRPGSDWPFRYEARQHIVLDDTGLSVRLWARNLANGPMPFGFGHHPYYPRTAGSRLTANVRAMWETDSEVLPIALNAHPAVAALRGGLMLDDFDLDNNFAGWHREARIDWPQQQRRLILRATAPLDFFVLFSPANTAYFCAEPVSNTTDWLNLRAAGKALDADVGGTVLAPGETLEATVAWLPDRS